MQLALQLRQAEKRATSAALAARSQLQCTVRLLPPGSEPEAAAPAEATAPSPIAGRQADAPGLSDGGEEARADSAPDDAPPGAAAAAAAAPAGPAAGGVSAPAAEVKATAEFAGDSIPTGPAFERQELEGSGNSTSSHTAPLSASLGTAATAIAAATAAAAEGGASLDLGGDATSDRALPTAGSAPLAGFAPQEQTLLDAAGDAPGAAGAPAGDGAPAKAGQPAGGSSSARKLPPEVPLRASRRIKRRM